MFRGNIPPFVQQMVLEVVKDWGPPPEIYVGCSGNFTIERVIHGSFPDVKLHGNDVHLPQAAMGNWFVDRDPRLELTDLGREQFPWLADYMESPEDRLATLMLAMKLVQTMDAEFNPRPNLYYERMRRGYREQWADMHKIQLGRLAKSTMRLESYKSQDVMTWIDDIPAGVPVICYPPFLGANADYMPENPKLEKIFEWSPTPFELLDKDRVEELFDKIADRPLWCFGVNKTKERFRANLIGRHKPTNRGTLMYVYGSSDVRRLVTPRQEVTAFHAPHLGSNEDLGAKIELRVLNYSQFAHLRSMYMNANIRPGTASVSIAVLVDGILIGCVAYAIGLLHRANWAAELPAPHAYMMSDFPVANTKYERLARLIAAIGTSKEARLICESFSNRRFPAVTTTAYSRNPSSMKYRGTFKVLRRRENDALNADWADDQIDTSDTYYSQKWELEYGAEFGVRSAQEIFDDWKAKHGSKR